MTRKRKNRHDSAPVRRIAGTTVALASVGFGFAPDSQFAFRTAEFGEAVVLFEFGGAVRDVDSVSSRYRRSLVDLSLICFIANGSGRICDGEYRRLRKRIDADENLDEREKTRLRANLDWLRIHPDLTDLPPRRIKKLKSRDMTEMRSMLIAAAQMDGVVQPGRVAKVEAVYAALGLDIGLVYSDLHAGGISDAPRTVRPPQPGPPGEAIPDEPPQPVDAPLDVERIASIRSDTERASTVLEEIFDAEEVDETATMDNEASPPDGLDRGHADLVHDLIGREHWTEEEFTELCSKRSLLASGALEAVNEWAFETYGEVLVEEDDGYHVFPETAEAVRKKTHDGETTCCNQDRVNGTP